jgi:hypothetical protein
MHAIMLCQGAQGHLGTWIGIGVEDIAPLFVEYRGKGVQFLQAPIQRPWANEMQVKDPDRHVLRFGSEPKDPRDARARCGYFYAAVAGMSARS